MSILIDMEMPRNCMGCKLYRGNIPEFNYTDSRVYRSFNGCPIKLEETIEDIRKLPSWCPLIEIPPHGRLIDADALIDNLPTWRHNHDADEMLAECMDAIGIAPTIIEAEGEE